MKHELTSAEQIDLAAVQVLNQRLKVRPLVGRLRFERIGEDDCLPVIAELLIDVVNERVDLGMGEAQPLNRIGELDVDAEIVRVELERVARPDAAVLVDLQAEDRDAVADVELPVTVP